MVNSSNGIINNNRNNLDVQGSNGNNDTTNDIIPGLNSNNQSTNTRNIANLFGQKVDYFVSSTSFPILIDDMSYNCGKPQDNREALRMCVLSMSVKCTCTSTDIRMQVKNSVKLRQY